MLALILIAGLAVSGYLVHRHHRRTAFAAHNPHAAPAPQRGISLDARTDYALGRATPEKLQREEFRQRPHEGRN